MCGFAGFIDLSGKLSRTARLEILRGMGEQIAHRGPDDEQFYQDDSLSLVFRRLSIVDVQSGRQPIWNENGKIFVVANGEIYNHRELRGQLKSSHQFKTLSDSEIILHLYEDYGEEAVKRLNGKFSAVIWDASKRQLFLARDRLGVKPLYYHKSEDLLIFGSELKALLVHPQCPREFSWNDFEPGFPNTEGRPLTTYVQGVHHLPGGHFAIHRENGFFQAKKYWAIQESFPDSNQSDRSDAEYIDQFAVHFETAVNDRMSGEAQFGVFLSGGLDSNAVAAVAAKNNPDLHCFSVVAEGSIQSGDAEAAMKLAKHLGVRFHGVNIDEKNFLNQLNFSLESFEYFVWLMDSPRFSSEFVFKHELHRYAKTVVPSLKVILLGQGADEIAGNYSHVAGYGKGKANWEQHLETDRQEYISRVGIPGQLLPFLNRESVIRSLEGGHSGFEAQIIKRAQFLQYFNLWHEDRTSSSQGIEARIPFLDHRLVEFMCAIPSNHFPRLFWDKAIIRAASERWMPKVFCHRPKFGFIYGKENRQITVIWKELLMRIFPDFLDKYMENSNSLVDRDALIFGYKQAIESNELKQIDTILNCMALVVFSELCRSLGKPIKNSFREASPLKEIDVIPRPAPPRTHGLLFRRVAANELWHSEDQPVFGPGIHPEFVFPDQIVIKRKEQVLKRFPVGNENYFEIFFKILSRVHQVRPGHILSLQEISDDLRIPLNSVKSMMSLFGANGWICKVEQEEDGPQARKSA